jgi:uroporphyrinogen decarboxylase
LASISETVARLAISLPSSTALIGFAGAPWTVASYMVAGRGTADQAPARALAENDSAAFQSIIDMLVEATIDYLAAQVAAGAEVLQLFESWAGTLRGPDFERWCIDPVAAIVSGLRKRGVNVPIIGFPRAAEHDMADYCARTGIQALGLDSSVDRAALAQNVPSEIILQGNLDPQILVEGGTRLEQEVKNIKQDFAGRPYIFNLGHGIVPQTPPQHVARLVELVREDT